jgi:GTPase SAR1 family protein
LNIVFIIGTAGSGKSELTASFTRWMELQREDVIAVNLDPGAIILPYSANVDVRDYIKVEDIMEEYSLGPNGGLVLACDIMVEIVDQLASDINLFGPDIAIVDTPGQMELFAFRDIGARIAEGLSDELKGVIYLFDSTFCRDPLNYVMNMFIALAINSRFMIPQISVLSKADLLEDEELGEISGWAEDSLMLEEAINSRLTGLNRLISQDMMEVINKLGMEFTPIPVSSRTNLGFTRLYAEMSRIFVGGERFTL